MPGAFVWLEPISGAKQGDTAKVESTALDNNFFIFFSLATIR
jgi:hypothetical protein